MAFSQNPFSVATFGESYEQANLTVALTGVQATSAIGTLTIVSKAVVAPTGVQATGTANTVTATGGTGVTFTLSSVSGKGVSGTTALNGSVTLVCEAVVIPTGVQGTFTVGNAIINTVQFDYESIKDNYSKARTVYIGSASSNTNTSYVNSASRTVYVGPASSNTNTSYVRAA